MVDGEGRPRAQNIAFSLKVGAPATEAEIHNALRLAQLVSLVNREAVASQP